MSYCNIDFSKNAWALRVISQMTETRSTSSIRVMTYSRPHGATRRVSLPDWSCSSPYVCHIHTAHAHMFSVLLSRRLKMMRVAVPAGTVCADYRESTVLKPHSVWLPPDGTIKSQRQVKDINFCSSGLHQVRSSITVSRHFHIAGWTWKRTTEIWTCNNRGRSNKQSSLSENLIPPPPQNNFLGILRRIKELGSRCLQITSAADQGSQTTGIPKAKLTV